MNQVAILYPVSVQVFLTLAVLFLLAIAYSRAIRTMVRWRSSVYVATAGAA